MGRVPQRGFLNSLASLREGLGLLSEGMGFLRRHRSLWILALVPIFFALLLTTLSLSVFWIQLDSLRAFVGAFFPVLEIGEWWSWIWVAPARALFWILGWLTVLLVLAILLIASLLGANILSAPFLDRLSERVESIATGAEHEMDSQAAGLGGHPSIWTQALRSFAAELQRVLFLAGMALGLTLVGFLVPGAQILTGPAIVLMTVLFLPLDYAGFALDRRAASFGDRRGWLREHRPLMLGFGGIAFVACLVPGLNLLLMPALVTAGTLLVLRREPAVARGANQISPGFGDRRS